MAGLVWYRDPMAVYRMPLAEQLLIIGLLDHLDEVGMDLVGGGRAVVVGAPPRRRSLLPPPSVNATPDAWQALQHFQTE